MVNRECYMADPWEASAYKILFVNALDQNGEGCAGCEEFPQKRELSGDLGAD